MGRGYNAFWIDPGTRFGVVKGETRTAWITDPPNGKIPYSDAGRKLAREGEAKLGYSDPESRPLPDRCLATGGRTGPPMINGLYNNHYQIVQTPTHVMIHTEMISHARVIPLATAHQPSAAAIHPLFGDSIAHYEGDKLVIETTNFNPYHAWQDHPAYLSGKRQGHRDASAASSKDELLYEFTVEDPAFYSQPWSGEITYWNDGERIYEYACHEGQLRDGRHPPGRARARGQGPAARPGARRIGEHRHETHHPYRERTGAGGVAGLPAQAQQPLESRRTIPSASRTSWARGTTARSPTSSARRSTRT